MTNDYSSNKYFLLRNLFYLRAVLHTKMRDCTLYSLHSVYTHLSGAVMLPCFLLKGL